MDESSTRPTGVTIVIEEEYYSLNKPEKGTEMEGQTRNW